MKAILFVVKNWVWLVAAVALVGILIMRLREPAPHGSQNVSTPAPDDGTPTTPPVPKVPHQDWRSLANELASALPRRCEETASSSNAAWLLTLALGPKAAPRALTALVELAKSEADPLGAVSARALLLAARRDPPKQSAGPQPTNPAQLGWLLEEFVLSRLSYSPSAPEGSDKRNASPVSAQELGTLFDATLSSIERAAQIEDLPAFSDSPPSDRSAPWQLPLSLTLQRASQTLFRTAPLLAPDHRHRRDLLPRVRRLLTTPLGLANHPRPSDLQTEALRVETSAAYGLMTVILGEELPLSWRGWLWTAASGLALRGRADALNCTDAALLIRALRQAALFAREVHATSPEAGGLPTQ